MKIVEQELDKKSFALLDIGTVFKDDDEYYMKTEKCKVEIGAYHRECNAVCLKNGCHRDFSSSYMVEIVNAELRVN